MEYLYIIKDITVKNYTIGTYKSVKQCLQYIDICKNMKGYITAFNLPISDTFILIKKYKCINAYKLEELIYKININHIGEPDWFNFTDKQLLICQHEIETELLKPEFKYIDPNEIIMDLKHKNDVLQEKLESMHKIIYEKDTLIISLKKYNKFFRNLIMIGS